MSNTRSPGMERRRPRRQLSSSRSYALILISVLGIQRSDSGAWRVCNRRSVNLRDSRLSLGDSGPPELQAMWKPYLESRPARSPSLLGRRHIAR